tara:strand:+ start:1544 stop:1852 length:309 start_codon:yes stop_codon:yes gene_type:complete
MAMNKSLIIRGRQTSINVGCVSPKAKLNGLRLKLITLFMILTFASGCTEFALLASGSSIAISQNAYVKAYNGIDMLTIMKTEKDIKKHVYENVKDLYDKTKY